MTLVLGWDEYQRLGLRAARNGRTIQRQLHHYVLRALARDEAEDAIRRETAAGG